MSPTADGLCAWSGGVASTFRQPRGPSAMALQPGSVSLPDPPELPRGHALGPPPAQTLRHFPSKCRCRPSSAQKTGRRSDAASRRAMNQLDLAAASSRLEARLLYGLPGYPCCCRIVEAWGIPGLLAGEYRQASPPRRHLCPVRERHSALSQARPWPLLGAAAVRSHDPDISQR